MRHGKSLVLKSSHEYAPDTKGLNGKKQSLRISGGGSSLLVSFRKQTGHEGWFTLRASWIINTTLILMIGCPLDLRHKIIISLKVQRNEDFTNRQTSSWAPSHNELFLSLQTQHFQRLPVPPLFFANWGRKTWICQKSKAPKERQNRSGDVCSTHPFSHHLENEDWQQLMAPGNHVWITHQRKHDLNHC